MTCSNSAQTMVFKMLCCQQSHFLRKRSLLSIEYLGLKGHIFAQFRLDLHRSLVSGLKQGLVSRRAAVEKPSGLFSSCYFLVVIGIPLSILSVSFFFTFIGCHHTYNHVLLIDDNQKCNHELHM